MKNPFQPPGAPVERDVGRPIVADRPRVLRGFVATLPLVAVIVVLLGWLRLEVSGASGAPLAFMLSNAICGYLAASLAGHVVLARWLARRAWWKFWPFLGVLALAEAAWLLAAFAVWTGQVYPPGKDSLARYTANLADNLLTFCAFSFVLTIVPCMATACLFFVCARARPESH